MAISLRHLDQTKLGLALIALLPTVIYPALHGILPGDAHAYLLVFDHTVILALAFAAWGARCAIPTEYRQPLSRVNAAVFAGLLVLGILLAQPVFGMTNLFTTLAAPDSTGQGGLSLLRDYHRVATTSAIISFWLLFLMVKLVLSVMWLYPWRLHAMWLIFAWLPVAAILFAKGTVMDFQEFLALRNILGG